MLPAKDRIIPREAVDPKAVWRAGVEPNAERAVSSTSGLGLAHSARRRDIRSKQLGELFAVNLHKSDSLQFDKAPPFARSVFDRAVRWARVG